MICSQSNLYIYILCYFFLLFWVLLHVQLFFQKSAYFLFVHLKKLCKISPLKNVTINFKYKLSMKQFKKNIYQPDDLNNI